VGKEINDELANLTGIIINTCECLRLDDEKQKERVRYLESEMAKMQAREPKDYAVQITTLQESLIMNGERQTEIELKLEKIKEDIKRLEDLMARQIKASVQVRVEDKKIKCEDSAVFNRNKQTLEPQPVITPPVKSKKETETELEKNQAKLLELQRRVEGKKEES